MTKNHSPQQGNLIDPPVVLDLKELLTESGLSENEQGIVTRRLIETSEPFEKFLQCLLRQAETETSTIDIHSSLKQLEKQESREIRSFDSIAKILSQDFPELLNFILEEYQVEAKKTRTLVGREFIVIKRIADVIFEAKDKKGNDVIIHLEFEREYKSDEHMDKRKLEYRHLMEMDEDYQGKAVLCNVFYLKGSPADKQKIEERSVKLPSSDPRYSGELKYKAYHLALMTIETILKRKLPFLLPFIVESELRTIAEPPRITASNHIASIQKQIDRHEEELSQMIEALSAEQMDSLRTTVEYLWGKSYSKKVFNQSNLVKLMRERLNLRQDDIRWGRTEGIAEGMAKGKSVAEQMLQNGEMTREQLEKFLKHMEELNKKEK
jgi:hypothetical protein